VKSPRQFVLAVFFLLAALFVGMLFWPFIMNEIIKPVSLVTWLLLRILVLSIPQSYYWGALIFIMLFFFYRLLPQSQTATYPSESQMSNNALRNIEYWHNLFLLTDEYVKDDKTLKRELIRLLISLYATKQVNRANFEIYEELQKGTIPLPQHIHTFLFSENTQNDGHSLKKRIQAIGLAPQKWVHRLTGQEAAEHNRKINEVLVFLETALEIKK